jgi:hypothetical protein
MARKPPTRDKILFYVSGHGFGHATRACALIASLRAGRPGISIEVRTRAPHWLFQDADPQTVCSEADIDVGMIQRNGLDIDFETSLAVHEGFVARWEEKLGEESAYIRSGTTGVVIGDIPALAFAAARKAAVPAFAVSNFSWDWILGSYAARERRWRPIADLYGKAYAAADALFRLPMHGSFPAFRRIEDVPMLVRRSRLSAEEARRALGLVRGQERPIVLLSFGGFGSGLVKMGQCEDLADFLFIGFGTKPEGLKAAWLGLPMRSPMPHVDVLAACDAVISKPGYGIFSEALAHRTKVLYVPRDNFPEAPCLVEAIERLGCSARIDREDFLRGRWRAPLERLLSAPATWKDIPLNGAETIAQRILARME